VASLLLLLAAIVMLLRGCQESSPRLRHAVKRRPRYTAQTRPDPPGRIGVLIAFIPQAALPPGGWTIETKLPLTVAPAWVVSPALPFALDAAFGTMAVDVAPIGFRIAAAGTPPTAPIQSDAARTRVGTFAVRGTVALTDLPRLVEQVLTQPEFVGLFGDPPLVSDVDEASCVLPPTGNASVVAQTSQQTTILAPKDVLLGIVDSGFSTAIIHAVAPDVKFDSNLGSTPSTALGQPGSAPGDEHGNMCAYDATLVATKATLIDIRTADPLKLRLSDAEAAYNTLLGKLQTDPTLKTRYQGLVLSNSWGLATPDSNQKQSERYFDNANHPFTKVVVKLSTAGADIVFAAGDSALCPPGEGEVGSIWGANSLEEVVSVAAVDLNKSRISYSAQGPGTLATQKPDMSSYSHFVGSDDGDKDTGTSASAAVVAGVIAAIRSQQGWGWLEKTPKEVKQRLRDTAIREVKQGDTVVTLDGWSRDFGFGIARMK